MALATVVSTVPVSLSAQVPPDEAWRTLTTAHFRVTFPERIEAVGRRAADRAERAYGELSDAFVDPPGGRIDILVTDHTDVSNGYAQIRPFQPDHGLRPPAGRRDGPWLFRRLDGTGHHPRTRPRLPSGQNRTLWAVCSAECSGEPRASGRSSPA